MSTQEKDKPIIDLSCDGARKQTFRKLLIGLIVAFVGSLSLGLFSSLPETIQMAVDLENESVPPWKVYTEVLCTVVLLGLLVWAIYELWNFRSAGLSKLAVVTFAPLFLVQTTPAPSTPFGDYLYGIESVLGGMILLMGWAFPSILTASAGSGAGETPPQPCQPQGAQAQ
jgi:hypothetical protein